MTRNLSTRIGTSATLSALLLSGASPALADYVLVYDVQEHSGYLGDNTSISATANSLFITDTFDQRAEFAWEINAAEATADGGVDLDLRYTRLNWDPYGARVSINFQILKEGGGLSPERVLVDAWGAVQLDYDISEQRPVARWCCYSEVGLNSPFDPLFVWYSAGIDDLSDGRHTGSVDSVFFGSYGLFTNTTYTLLYDSALYVETSPGERPQTWAEYQAFVNEHGLSGVSYHEVQGFVQFGMTVRSVPEPGTLALLGLGLVGMGYARRRKAA